MPNHVINVLRAPHRVIEALKGPEDAVDFNQIVPQPANIEQGGCSGRHDPGVVCWYEWNTANWGTKWNAYSIETDQDVLESVTGDGTVAKLNRDIISTVKFDTAWAHPDQIIKALSERFPTDQIEVMYADEDLGYNYGLYSILNGVMVVGGVEPFGRGTNEAKDFAAYMKYGKSYEEILKEWDE